MTKRDDQKKARAAMKAQLEKNKRELMGMPETQKLFTRIRQEPHGHTLEVTGIGINVGFQGLPVSTVNKLIDLLEKEREDEAAEEQMESDIHGGIAGG